MQKIGNCDRKLRKLSLEYTINSILRIINKGYCNLIINFGIVFIADTLIFIYIFNNKSPFNVIELATKISLFSLVITISASYLSMFYFRYKDTKREIFKEKLITYNEIMKMLIDNEEILKLRFPCRYDTDNKINTIVSQPCYTVWHDICNSYRYYTVDSVVQGYLNLMMEYMEVFNNTYHRAEKGIHDDILQYIRTFNDNAIIVENIGNKLFNDIVIRGDVTLEIYSSNSYFVKIDIDYDNNKIIKIINENEDFKTLVACYRCIKEYNNKVLKYIRNEIELYYS